MTPYLQDPDVTIWQGDALEVLREMPDESVDCCVTSPPYWGLRDYQTGEWDGGDPDCDHLVREDARTESSTLGGGKATTGHQREGFKDRCPRCGATRVDRQLGLESSPDEYVTALVSVFREVRRVLSSSGTVWLNLGDSYASSNRDGHGTRIGEKQGTNRASAAGMDDCRPPTPIGLKPKDLIMMPARVALALQADGWWLRSEIVWDKSNAMPESVKDRPTKAHEMVYLLAKSERYYFGQDDLREPASYYGPNGSADTMNGAGNPRPGEMTSRAGVKPDEIPWKNTRDVWRIATEPTPFAHFATMPKKLAKKCVLGGCPPGGTVLDPFAGSGTTAIVARAYGRRSVLIELNEEYAELAAARLSQQSLFA